MLIEQMMIDWDKLMEGENSEINTASSGDLRSQKWLFPLGNHIAEYLIILTRPVQNQVCLSIMGNREIPKIDL